jgi:hypothetical protein
LRAERQWGSLSPSYFGEFSTEHGGTELTHHRDQEEAATHRNISSSIALPEVRTAVVTLLHFDPPSKKGLFFRPPMGSP